MINPADYTIGVPAEDMSKYCPGGYHPVYLRERLHNRYEVLHKLGFGSFSTVWLAHDSREQRNVAIKVVTAKKSDETTHELRILQTLEEQGDPGHPGRPHVSRLLDSFYVEGPNGRHACLVLNLLGPSASSVADNCANHRLDGKLARSLSRQVLQAVHYIHSAGVAHGDIHAGNILFRLPELEALSPEDAIKELGSPDVGKVSRRDRALLEPGVPEYVVEPIEYSARILADLREVQLVDFAFFTADPPERITTPLSLHPPELVFHHPLSSAVDIWNLGCTTAELVTGRTPFEADFQDDTALVPQFEKVLGGVPEPWIHDALRSGVLKEPPDSSSAEDFLSLGEDIQRCYFEGRTANTLSLGHSEIGMLVEYLRRLLVVEPGRRAASRELLHDAWVCEGDKRKPGAE